MSTEPTSTNRIREEFSVRGNQVVETIKKVVDAGNVRRVLIKHDGRVVVEFPLTAGVVGTLIAPQIAAIGAVAALLTESTIEIIRSEEPPSM